ncbi:hypothetical protein LJR066_002867 [Acidovorax sp. LjRoot66]|uniref:hypothetical protein n=1 Tax=Acidovorax sp. LjRoot66 TaxID=3342334 RepID=UPI003ECCF39C
MKRWVGRHAPDIALWFGGLSLLAAVVVSAWDGPKLPDEVKACRLLDVAMQEADMAEGWYLEAGKVLGGHCGIKEAPVEAERKACFARRKNDNTIDCE